MVPGLDTDLAFAEQLAEDDRSDSTRKAYHDDLSALQRYLGDHGEPTKLPVGPRAIAAFVGYQASENPATGQPRHRISTIERRLAGIAAAHRDAGHANPCVDPLVRGAIRGARRHLPSAPEKKQHLELEDLEEMLRHLPPTSHRGRRDRALLLLGIAGALRRSELVAIDVSDIKRVPEGLVLTIGKSKTDQKAKGYKLAIARGDRADLCAVRALEAWMTAAQIRRGPVFIRIRRGDNLTSARLGASTVAELVKKYARLVGLDPDVLAGHSLRSGGITAARRNGHDEDEIAKLSRHRNMEILRGYIGQADQFDGVAQVLRSQRL